MPKLRINHSFTVNFNEYLKPFKIFVPMDQFILYWNEWKSCISVFSIQPLDTGDTVGEGDIQDLCLSQKCVTSPQSLLLDDHNAYLLMYGFKFIYFITLPPRYRKTCLPFGDGESMLPCKAVPLADSLIKGARNLVVTQCCFSPLTRLTSERIIVALFSDDYLRLFNSTKPSEVLLNINLNTVDEFDLIDSSLSSFNFSGDQFIAMDFGRSFKIDKNDKFQTFYPLYLLKSSGDVHCLYFHPDYIRNPPCLTDAMRVYPSSGSNYGSCATSLICLQSIPPVLAIILPEGDILHCVVLQSENPELSNLSPTLWVYEVMKIGNNSVNVMRDPHFWDRYFVYSSDLFASVNLTWLTKLNYLYEKVASFDESSLMNSCLSVKSSLKLIMTVPSRGQCDNKKCDDKISGVSMSKSLITEHFIFLLLNNGIFIIEASSLPFSVADRETFVHEYFAEDADTINAAESLFKDGCFHEVSALMHKSSLPLIKLDHGGQSDEGILPILKKFKEILGIHQSICNILHTKKSEAAEKHKKLDEKISKLKEDVGALWDKQKKLMKEIEDNESFIEDVVLRAHLVSSSVDLHSAAQMDENRHIKQKTHKLLSNCKQLHLRVESLKSGFLNTVETKPENFGIFYNEMREITRENSAALNNVMEKIEMLCDRFKGISAPGLS